MFSLLILDDAAVVLEVDFIFSILTRDTLCKVSYLYACFIGIIQVDLISCTVVSTCTCGFYNYITDCL